MSHNHPEGYNNIAAVCDHCAKERLEKYQKEHANRKYPHGSFVKARFADDGSEKGEYMWVQIHEEIHPGIYSGRLDNIPVVVKSIHHKDIVLVSTNDICECIEP
jgi:hypothetical protein